eukprot:TRINITY_DN3662_c0_g1_i1.p1 TRINITY_DN3662_c0_g1~~TRINITY_DN3662_c0_g1_i1.p1  ORF type:complete len:624 (-),score=162.18 TRINITY_DN3662_c0_g1_i1:70-1941(-)
MSNNIKRSLGTDVHSWSNFTQIKTVHINLVLRVDFARKVFIGYADHTLEAVQDGVSFVQFDAKNLSIADVTSAQEDATYAWTLPDFHPALGQCLRVELPAPLKAGDKTTVRIQYSTTIKSGGIQWFEPEQTAGGKHPYVYTQCQAILSRTLLPCQDTPAVKAPYSVSIAVPDPLVAIASGLPKSSEPEKTADGWLVYSYDQPNKIPSYLIAIAAGALKKKAIGPRSSIWTEAELLDAAVHEFEEDTETFIKAGETLLGLPYEWGVYDLLVLPTAFPYGGMENPNITFVNASLLAGDRSLVDVVAHEIAHSWSGNLATNSSWKDFWLNEGFTMYIERLILGQHSNSEEYRRFQLLLGYKELVRTVADLLKTDPEFTKLRPDLTGTDPDDAFSIVPYEKGCLFLFFLESRVAGGIDAMKGWLNSLYSTFRTLSYTSEQMRAHCEEYFKKQGKENELKQVDWSNWFDAEGLPKYDPTEELTNQLSTACTDLANRWLSDSQGTFSLDDIKNFKPSQSMFFLDELLTSPSMPLKAETAAKIEATYNFSTSINVEIAYRAQLLSLRCNNLAIIPIVDDFLGKVGRGRYVKPLYYALNEVDHSKAVEIYNRRKNRYHSVIRNAFDNLLKA